MHTHVAAVLFYLEAAARIQGNKPVRNDANENGSCHHFRRMSSTFPLRILTSPLREGKKENLMMP